MLADFYIPRLSNDMIHIIGKPRDVSYEDRRTEKLSNFVNLLKNGDLFFNPKCF